MWYCGERTRLGTSVTVQTGAGQVGATTSQIFAQIQENRWGGQGSFCGREPSYSIPGSRPEGQALLLVGTTIQGS